MSATPPRHSNVALIVSLCVNLVLAGVIATAVFRFAVHPTDGRVVSSSAPMAPSPERVQVRQILTPHMLMRAAPAKADAIRDVIKAHRDRIDPLRAASQVARREVLRLYGAPTFDKPAFDQALARMQAADAAVFTEVLKVASESGALLSPEERKKAAEWQQHDHEFGHEHGQGFGGNWQHRGPHGDGPNRDAPNDGASNGNRPQ